MKNKILTIALFMFTVQCFAQNKNAGSVIVEKILSNSLKKNKGGEDPYRSVTVYLPPGYEQGHQRYPVIYYLHGFQMNDTMFIEGAHIDKLMDQAVFIPTRHLRVIGKILLQKNWLIISIKNIGQFQTGTAGDLQEFRWADMEPSNWLCYTRMFLDAFMHKVRLYWE